MRRAACLAITLTLAMGVGSAFAQEECDHLNITFKPNAPAIEPGDYLYDTYVPMIAAQFGLDVSVFEWCWTQRVIGTIKGRWVSCGGMALAMFDPFGLGIGPDMYGNPGIIISRRGDIYTMSYGLSKYDAEENWIAFGGITWYGDGTGLYAGADGWGTDRPKRIPPTFWIRSVGYLCLAEPSGITTQ